MTEIDTSTAAIEALQDKCGTAIKKWAEADRRAYDLKAERDALRAEVDRLNSVMSEFCGGRLTFDDEAVIKFAGEMRAKMQKAREKGRSGWDDPEQCSGEYLTKLLVEHLTKGNPGTFVDVANFCMMLHLRGISPVVMQAEVDRLRAQPVAAPRKTFPILRSHGARFDYQIVIDHGKQVMANHYQTVEMIAERGGLSWGELHAVLNNRACQKIDENEAIAECRAIEARYLTAIETGEVKPAERARHIKRGACATCGTFIGLPHQHPCEAGPGPVTEADTSEPAPCSR